MWNSNTIQSLLLNFSLVLLTVFWGTSNIALKYAVSEITPLQLFMVRHLLAVFILFIYLVIRRELIIPDPRHWKTIFLLGLTGVFIYQIILGYSLIHTTATNSAWLGMLAPIFILLISLCLRQEKLTLAKAAGIVLALVGTLVIIKPDGLVFSKTAQNSYFGDLLAIIAALAWAIYSVVGKKILEIYSPLLITFYALVIGFFLSVPLAINSDWLAAIRQVSLSGWLAIVYLALVCTVVSYLIWYNALAKVEASLAGAYLYGTPLVTTIVAKFTINEQIGLFFWCGFAAIFFGVWLVARTQ